MKIKLDENLPVRLADALRNGLKNTHIEGSFIVLTDRKLRITHPPQEIADLDPAT